MYILVHEDSEHRATRQTTAAVVLHLPARIAAVIDDPMLAAIRARLTAALGPPRGPYTALRVEGHAIAWVNPERARRLAGFADVFVSTNGALMVRASLASDAARTDAFSEVARTLAAEGALTAWRDEPYAVAPSLAEPALFELEGFVEIRVIFSAASRFCWLKFFSCIFSTD